MLTVKIPSIFLGYRSLFDRLEFSVHPGQAMHIKGVNGAGKTTLLKAIIGQIHPDIEVLLDGSPLSPDNITFIGTKMGLNPLLTCEENLSFWYEFCNNPGLSPLEALSLFDTLEYQDIPVKNLSYGQQRRVSLSKLLIRQTPVRILDEPMNGLDQTSQEILRHVCEEHLDEGGILIYASHQDINFSRESTLELPGGKVTPFFEKNIKERKIA